MSIETLISEDQQTVIELTTNNYELVSLEQESTVIQIQETTTDVLEIAVPGLQGPQGPISNDDTIAQAVEEYLTLNPIEFSYDDLEDKPDLKNGATTQFFFGSTPPPTEGITEPAIWIRTFT